MYWEFKTNAEREAYAAGMQEAWQRGAAAGIAAYVRGKGGIGGGLKEITATAVTGGASSAATSAMQQVQSRVALSGMEISVEKKLSTYLLNMEHPVGGAKAKWFDQALGFNQSNIDSLAKQIVLDPRKSVEVGVTQFGTKYNQVIPITGANGRVIDVNFGWVRNNDGINRLVTAIPTPR